MMPVINSINMPDSQDFPEHYFEPDETSDSMYPLKKCRIDIVDPSLEEVAEFETYRQALIIIRQKYRYEFGKQDIKNLDRTAYERMAAIRINYVANINDLKEFYIQVVEEMPFETFERFLNDTIIKNNVKEGTRFTNPEASLRYVGISNKEMSAIYFKKLVSHLGSEDKAFRILNPANAVKKVGMSLVRFLDETYIKLYDLRTRSIHANPETAIEALSRHSFLDEGSSQEIIDVTILVSKMLVNDPIVYSLFDSVSRELDEAASKARQAIFNIKQRQEMFKAIGEEIHHNIPDIDACSWILGQYLSFSPKERERRTQEWLKERRKKNNPDES